MVTNVIDALRAASHLDDAIAAPAWLDPLAAYRRLKSSPARMGYYIFRR